MKKAVFIFVWLFACIITYTNAQIREGVLPMSRGSHNALTIELPLIGAKIAGDTWLSYIKPYKGKTKIKSGEYFTDNATIKQILGNNTIDIYARFSESNGNTTMNVWFDLGGAYLSSYMHRDAFPGAEKLLNDFIKEATKAHIADALKNEEAKLKSLEKELSSLEKEKSRMEKSIKDMEAQIEKMKQEIILNERNQQSKNEDITQQKNVVSELQQKAKQG